MQRYFDVVQNSTGKAISGATVTIFNQNGSLATIYSDNGVTPITNPTITNADGEYTFFAANGRYSISIVGFGYGPESRDGVILFDPVDQSGSQVPYTPNSTSLLNGLAQEAQTALNLLSNRNNGGSYVGFQQAGVDTVPRTTQNKLRDIVSVKDYGAVGDGTADDTTAIQKAIDANSGKTIYFPSGTYRITSKLRVTTEATRLLGASRYTFILATGVDQDILHFEHLQLDGSFLQDCGISGLYLLRSTAATSGAALRLTRCANFEATDFFTLGMPEGVRLEGGQFNNLSNFRIFAGSTFDLSGTANSCGLRFSQAPLLVGFQPCYTTTVSQFYIASGGRWQASILIANGDGLAFSDGYVNSAKQAELRIYQDRDASYVAPVSFTNVYFDCVFTSSNSLHVPDDGFTAHITALNFTNCFLGQSNSTTALIRKACQIEFVGTQFGNSNGWAIDAESTQTRLQIIGGRLYNLGILAGVTGGIRFANGHSLVICGTSFHDDSGTAGSIRLDGVIGSVTLTGLTFRGTSADVSNTATISNYVYSGCNSDKTAAANSLMGLRPGNVAVTDTRVLDWYQEGTFTPSILFGGAETGNTYAGRNGRYTRIGNVILFNIYVQLSAKGSATGFVTVGGLPTPSNAAFAGAFSVRLINGNTGSQDYGVSASMGGSLSAISICKAEAGGTSFQMSDTDFKNNTAVQLGGYYEV